jgi:hypothetical protein
MRVKLRGGVTLHRPRAIVLELGRNPLAGCFGRMVAAYARLYVVFQLAKGNLHAFPVRVSHPFVTADQRRE